MDVDKLIEKALRWLSDPRGREVVKSLLYVLIPLIILSLLRNIKRAQAAKKQATAITPRMRSSSTENLVATETLQETMAKEKKKIERELQEVFGRRERLLTKTRRGEAFHTETPHQSRSVESSAAVGDQGLRDDLIRVFLGRRSQ